jgi:hypothetical protein
MALFALVYNGAIIETAAAPFEVAPALVWTSDISSVTPAPQPGWTATEAAGAWTFAAPPAPPTPTLAQQAAAALTAGLTITSPTLDLTSVTFDVGSDTQSHINSEINAILLTGAFADGGATVSWPDMAGVDHTFTVAQAKAFFAAVGAYVAALFKVQNGTLTTLPAATVTLA